MKSLGAFAGSVRPQQQSHQLDPRARPLDSLHGRGPSGLQAGGTSARRHHRPHPVPGRGRHRPRLARVSHPADPPASRRPTRHEPRRPTDPSPGAYVPQSPRRRHLGLSGPPAVVHPQRLLAVADRLGRRGLLYPRITSHTPHVERARTPPPGTRRGGHDPRVPRCRPHRKRRGNQGKRAWPSEQRCTTTGRSPEATTPTASPPTASCTSLATTPPWRPLRLPHPQRAAPPRSRRQSRVTGRHPALKCNQHH